MDKRWISSIVCSLSVAMISACGTDKQYGDPLDPATASNSATNLVNATLSINSDVSNDAPLNAINSLSAQMNYLGGIKLQAIEGNGQDYQSLQSAATARRRVDESCVEISEGSWIYTECEYAGASADGSVSFIDGRLQSDLVFTTIDEDFTMETSALADLEMADNKISGYFDFKVKQSGDGFEVNTIFDADYNLTMEEGCAVGGSVEMKFKASAAGRSQTVWVLAEFGPVCGDVVVR